MFKIKLYLHGIPKDKSDLVSETVYQAIDLGRQFLEISNDVEIHVGLIANPQDVPNLLSKGLTSKKNIYIHIKKKYLYSRNFYKKLASTVIHEYTHFVRMKLKKDRAKTLLDFTLIEGVAIYVQSSISNPPEYLDIKRLSSKTVLKYWNIFSLIMDKSLKKRTELDDPKYFILIYRIGYWLVLQYMNTKKISYLELVNTHISKLNAFSKKHIKEIKTLSHQ